MRAGELPVQMLVVPRSGTSATSLLVPVPLVRDPQVATPVLRGLALGMVDAYMPAPGAMREEAVHCAVAGLLEDWAHDTVPGLPAVRIIAERQTPCP